MWLAGRGEGKGGDVGFKWADVCVRLERSAGFMPLPLSSLPIYACLLPPLLGVGELELALSHLSLLAPCHVERVNNF